MPRARALALAALILVPAAVAAAPPRLTPAEVRDFVARQSRAWNTGDLAAFYGLFTADAVFADQARAPNGEIFPYGSSTLAQAEAQTRRSLARAKAHETTVIRSIAIAADGASATVASQEVSEVTQGGRTTRSCAERVQVIVATPKGPRSKGQTDSIVRCR